MFDVPVQEKFHTPLNVNNLIGLSMQRKRVEYAGVATYLLDG